MLCDWFKDQGKYFLCFWTSYVGEKNGSIDIIHDYYNSWWNTWLPFSFSSLPSFSSFFSYFSSSSSSSLLFAIAGMLFLTIKYLVTKLILLSAFSPNRFAPLFKKYYDEIYQAELVFVSFLHQQHSEGQMIIELKRLGFSPKQLRLDGSRPDLSKLDDLFGQLSTTTVCFEEELAAAESIAMKYGICKLFEGLKINSA